MLNIAEETEKELVEADRLAELSGKRLEHKEIFEKIRNTINKKTHS